MHEGRTVLVTGGAGFIGARFVTHHLRAQPHDRIIVLDALTYAASLENLMLATGGSDRVRFLHGSPRRYWMTCARPF
jgi:dTDP-glucose 4,6-dehydratase